jgi:hypothetical protein
VDGFVVSMESAEGDGKTSNALWDRGSRFNGTGVGTVEMTEDRGSRTFDGEKLCIRCPKKEPADSGSWVY